MNIRKPIATALAAVLLGGSLAVASVLPAAATYEECVPQEAWTEVTPDIEHPAVGEEFITIENPDYVPAVEEVSHIVHHEAVTETVHHEAVTHTEWKYSKHGGWGFIWVDNDTFKYIKGDGTGTDEKPRYGEFYERTQHTREVTDTEAWDEVVVVTEAWDEKVIDVEAQPAQGEPTIEIENPDYVAAWTEDVPDIEHPAVICEEEPVVAPANPQAEAHAVCGAADVWLHNPLDQEADEQLTASFIIELDGEFYGAYAVAADESELVEFTFAEDTGEHTIEVFQAGTSEYGSIGSWTVPSDCQQPPIEEPEEPQEPNEPAEPGTGGKPAAPASLSGSETPVVPLAETGGTGALPALLLGLLLLAAGSFAFVSRRKAA
jgi:LPXTG-motif cell wall-anchored protein